METRNMACNYSGRDSAPRCPRRVQRRNGSPPDASARRPYLNSYHGIMIKPGAKFVNQRRQRIIKSKTGISTSNLFVLSILCILSKFRSRSALAALQSERILHFREDFTIPIPNREITRICFEQKQTKKTKSRFRIGILCCLRFLLLSLFSDAGAEGEF